MYKIYWTSKTLKYWEISLDHLIIQKLSPTNPRQFGPSQVHGHVNRWELQVWVPAVRHAWVGQMIQWASHTVEGPSNMAPWLLEGKGGAVSPKNSPDILLIENKTQNTTSGCSDQLIFGLSWLMQDVILQQYDLAWHCMSFESMRYWRIRVSIRFQTLQLYAHSCSAGTAVFSVAASILREAVSSVLKPTMLFEEHLVPSKQTVTFKLEDLKNHCS